MNNSIFHQIAEQLQQQNLEHLRQQLLEQQQPQKVDNPILWSLLLPLSTVCHLVIFLQLVVTRKMSLFKTFTVFVCSVFFVISKCALAAYISVEKLWKLFSAFWKELEDRRHGVSILQCETFFPLSSLLSKIMVILLLLMMMMTK